MKKNENSFKVWLGQKLAEAEFKKAYEEEKAALQIAYKITLLRKKQKLTQEELAERMGTSQQAVSRLESGHHENVTLNTLEKVAAATHTNLIIDFERGGKLLTEE